MKTSNELKIYNSLRKEKETFKPIHESHIGMYVCGPTVYNEVHLGNCRTFMSFDIVFRYLKHLGYKVRYVRNITDVGHLVGDVDTGSEGKIAKRARLEKLEPMEIVQKYTNSFHKVMAKFNTLPPSIEPTATGHIIEQIEMVQSIIDNGYGYEVNGSVYFDVQKLVSEGKIHDHIYGHLSGKKQEDLFTATRDDLKNQGEKRHPSDFAIWVKAAPNHIMRWQSPWSEGFPGWHLECSAMSTKYLGDRFDIHGGGLDLQFPHHENEIAQNMGACGCAPVNYWMHANMLLLNGKKMSKSKGNSILPKELFDGGHKMFEDDRGYSPMTVRFFMLQAHYRSELNITQEGLDAAEKGYARLMHANQTLDKLDYLGKETITKKDTELLALLAEANELAVALATYNAEGIQASPKIFLATAFASFALLNKLEKLVNPLVKNYEQNHSKNDLGKTLWSIQEFVANTIQQLLDMNNTLRQLPVQLNKFLELDLEHLLGDEASQTKRLRGQFKGFEKKMAHLVEQLTNLNQHNAIVSDPALAREDAIRSNLNGFYEKMNDDFHTPSAIANLFELSKQINQIKKCQLHGTKNLSLATFNRLQNTFSTLIFEVLGLKDETLSMNDDGDTLDQVLQMLIKMRQDARQNKDFATSDKIRNELHKLGIQLHDNKTETTWEKI
ncbi:MAG: cysteine--tRNA ligase [Saprospiraceae bacterium]|nr:cysteine--tRNA ligase [Saprospiraceae bacterium]